MRERPVRHDGAPVNATSLPVTLSRSLVPGSFPFLCIWCKTNASTSLLSLLILHRLVICHTYFPSRFDLDLFHIQCPPPASRLRTTPTPLPLSLCTAFPPLPPRPRFPNTLTLLQIPVSSACIQTTPPALVECIRLSHRTSPILLFVFCSLPCMTTPFPSK